MTLPPIPRTAPYRSWLRVPLERFLMGRWPMEKQRNGNVHNQPFPPWKSPFTEHGKAKGQLSHILQTDFPTAP